MREVSFQNELATFLELLKDALLGDAPKAAIEFDDTLVT